MKKKIMAVALAAALFAIVVGSTLAYFTAEDTATNEFTIGSVEIDLEENFEKPNNMVPVVTVDSSDPGYIKKEAWVENTGKNDAYVQAYVAIPKALDDVGAFVVVDGGTDNWGSRVFAGTANIKGVTYNVYSYRYKTALAPEAATENFIVAAYLAPELDYRDGKFIMKGTAIDYTPGESIDIHVAAQAIQAQGFADADTALNTFTKNPWNN